MERSKLNSAIAFITKKIETHKEMMIVGDGHRNATIQNYQNVLDCLIEQKEFLNKIVGPYNPVDDINCLDDVMIMANDILDKTW